MRLLAMPVKIVRCVIPAQAGIHLAPFFAYALWIPACAGMTHRESLPASPRGAWTLPPGDAIAATRTG